MEKTSGTYKHLQHVFSVRINLNNVILLQNRDLKTRKHCDLLMEWGFIPLSTLFQSHSDNHEIHVCPGFNKYYTRVLRHEIEAQRKKSENGSRIWRPASSKEVSSSYEELSSREVIFIQYSCWVFYQKSKSDKFRIFSSDLLESQNPH